MCSVEAKLVTLNFLLILASNSILSWFLFHFNLLNCILLDKLARKNVFFYCIHNLVFNLNLLKWILDILIFVTAIIISDSFWYGLLDFMVKFILFFKRTKEYMFDTFLVKIIIPMLNKALT